MINKKLFYDAYRAKFGPIKKDATVTSLDAIIDEFNRNNISVRPVEKMAYMLASVRHECGPDMLPITENLNYSARRLTEVWPSRFPTIDIAKKYANDPQVLGNFVYGGRLGNGVLEGYKYRGRGFIQLTGYVNYKKFGEKLNVDLLQDPDLAKDVTIGAKILFTGVMEGMFTGKKISSSINAKKVDYAEARDVVNADKGRVGASLAADCKRFEDVLRSSITEK